MAVCGLVAVLGGALPRHLTSGSPPSASAALRPQPAYTQSTLRGSASFHDADGHREEGSTYRWLRNGNVLATGQVPQTLLLPFDGTLASTDGEQPLESHGLSFVAGRFGQAV